MVLPPEVSFQLGLSDGAMGLALGAEYWILSDLLAAEFHWRRGGYTLSMGSTKASDSLSSMVVGARFRPTLDNGLVVDALVGFHMTDIVAFRYVNGRASAEVLNMQMSGLRVGAAINYDVAGFALRAELAETFAPGPLDTHLGVQFDRGLGMEFKGLPLLITGGYGLDFRRTTQTIDGIDATLGDLQNTLTLGVGVTL